MNPLEQHRRTTATASRCAAAAAATCRQPRFAATFHNEPPADFAVAANRDAMQAALADVRRQIRPRRIRW